MIFLIRLEMQNNCIKIKISFGYWRWLCYWIWICLNRNINQNLSIIKSAFYFDAIILQISSWIRRIKSQLSFTNYFHYLNHDYNFITLGCYLSGSDIATSSHVGSGIPRVICPNGMHSYSPYYVWCLQGTYMLLLIYYDYIF